MDNSKIEIEFLNKIKNAIEVNGINETNGNIKHIIKNLNYLKEMDKVGGPDYAHDKYYFEKFSIDSSEKKKNREDKSYSRKKVIDNKIEKESKYQSNIFNTLSFSGEDIRTNIRYMRANLKEMVKQKLNKKERYKKNYPNGEVFGLIIEIEDYCQVYTNENGEYFSTIRDTSDLKLEKYEIYKDYNLIKEIKEIYKDSIELLVFVESANFGKVKINYIDLKNIIQKNKMKIYPDKIFQICSGSVNVITSSQIDNTNIQYESEEAIKIEVEEIQLNGWRLRKHCEPNVYADDKRLLFYETTQKRVALNPEVSSTEFLYYFNTLIMKQIELKVNERKYILNKTTPLNSYMHLSFELRKGIYRINKNKILEFTFKEIGI